MFELGSRIDELEEDSVSIEDLIKSQKQLIEFYRQKDVQIRMTYYLLVWLFQLQQVLKGLLKQE